MSGTALAAGKTLDDWPTTSTLSLIYLPDDTKFLFTADENLADEQPNESEGHPEGGLDGIRMHESGFQERVNGDGIENTEGGPFPGQIFDCRNTESLCPVRGTSAIMTPNV